MQAIRSLIARLASSTQPASAPAVPQPVPLNAQELAQVAGGLPNIGGWDVALSGAASISTNS